VDARSSMAAVEVGGGPWWAPWDGSCRSDPLQARIIGARVDVKNILPWFLLPLPPGYEYPVRGAFHASMEKNELFQQFLKRKRRANRKSTNFAPHLRGRALAWRRPS